MTNSAHDEITVLISDEDLKGYRNLLKRHPSLENVYEVLELISKMHSARNAQSEDRTGQRLTLTHTWDDLDIELRFLLGDGQFHSPLSKEDLNLLQTGKFTLRFVKRGGLQDPIRALKLSDLLKLMDLYGVGRPSTYAKILQELVEGNYIVLKKEEGAKHHSVLMTEKAYGMLMELREKVPDVAEAKCSTRLTTYQRHIESKKHTVTEALEGICQEILPQHLVERAVDQLWSDVDELYCYEPEIENLRACGMITCPTGDGCQIDACSEVVECQD